MKVCLIDRGGIPESFLPLVTNATCAHMVTPSAAFVMRQFGHALFAEIAASMGEGDSMIDPESEPLVNVCFCTAMI